MRQRIAALITWLSVAMLAALGPAASISGQTSIAPAPIYQASVPLSAPPGLTSSNQPVTVMVELADPSAISAPSGAEAALQSRRLTAAQAPVMQRLLGLKAQVLFRTTLVYNGIAVSIPGNLVDQIRALPGVAAVHVIPPKQRSNAATVSLVGAPAAWSALNGVTGSNIRIGIIDSGIDYTHADFGGPGTPVAYTANNSATVELGSFPTAKVVGGFDFAGTNYDALGILGSPIPAPDPDPLDCNGHGTHVAGTAAGFGVTADGATYHGPYNSSVDFSSFLVGPGVAPEAQLYALKIFGCQGSTVLMTQAIERALDPNGDGDPSDHLDVLNISLGSPFGSNDDPDAVALNNAIGAGIVAVVAVGDNDNTFYVADSPATAQLAIAVGASTAQESGGALPGSMAPFSSRGPQRGNNAIKPELVAPGVNISSAAIGTGTAAQAMSGTSTAAAQVAGAAALLRQLHPQWSPEQIKAALINTTTPVQAAPGTPAPPSLAGAGRLDMTNFVGLDLLAYAGDEQPTVGLMFGAPWVTQPLSITRLLKLDNQSDTARTVNLSVTTTTNEPGVTVELPPGPISLAAREQALVPVTVSVDPRALDFTPDAATPLEQESLPRHFLAEHGGTIDITSSSSLTGVRVRPAHAAHFRSVDFYLDDQLLDDSLDSREVQEYSETTPGVHTIRLLRPGAAPNSRPLFTAQVELVDGRDYTLIVVGRPGALGIVVVDETPPAAPSPGQALMHFVNANRTEPNWNLGSLDVYLDGQLQVQALPAGQASPYIPVAPGPHAVQFFRAGANPPQTRPLAHKSFVVNAGELLLVGSGRHDDDDWDLGDAEQRVFIGRDLFTSRASTNLRVPFQIFPKSASDAHAVATSITVPSGAPVFTVGIRNTGARNAPLSGVVAGPQTPMASAFELAASSPAIPGLSQSLRAADVQYFGITSDFAVAQNIAGTRIFFGLASYGPWSTPNEVQFLVYIDSNLDGVDDYLLVNTNWGAFTGRPTDVFISPLYKIMPDGTLVANTYTTWGAEQPPTISPGVDVTPFNTSVMFQMAGGQGIGLTPGQTRFRYHIETRARDANNFGQVVDRVPTAGTLEYDVAHPAITPINTASILFRRTLFLDVEGGLIVGTVDPAVLAARGSQPMLILHHHNPPAQQAEVVELRSSGIFFQQR